MLIINTRAWHTVRTYPLMDGGAVMGYYSPPQVLHRKEAEIQPFPPSAGYIRMGQGYDEGTQGRSGAGTWKTISEVSDMTKHDAVTVFFQPKAEELAGQYLEFNYSDDYSGISLVTNYSDKLLKKYLWGSEKNTVSRL